MLESPARHPDRRRRPRRRVLPGDRAGQGPHDQGDLRRRGVRAPAARLPLRRAVPPRADLPHRRPRRPRRPARAAADLRHRAVRGDRGGAAHRADRRQRAPLGVGRRRMLTVKDLVGALELELAAGERAASAPIRWVHVSELSDPTPWLSGGELLLSTGMALLDADSQRAYVRQLVEHHLAGLGFGVGFGHDDAAARRSSTRPARSTSRCSPCPTRCRSSRSPSGPSRAWSTSSSTCSSARSRSSAGWSASCSTSAASARSCAASRTRSARP